MAGLMAGMLAWGCASAMRTAPGAAPEHWVAVQVPPKSDDVTPPIETTKVLDVFASHADCESFREGLLADAAAMDAPAMLEQASAVRCIRAARPTPRPTPGR